MAIVACDKPDKIPRYFQGKDREISEILRMRLYEFAKHVDLAEESNVRLRLTVMKYSLPKKDYEFPDQRHYDAIIVSGSMADISSRHIDNTPWMKRLINFITDLRDKIPTLGICFGHQAVARAYDSHIEDLPIPEEGFYPLTLTTAARSDPLFYSLPERFQALFSHGQYITPSPGTLLVEGDSPSIQAFRIGKMTWGIQFHPDFSPETVRSAIEARRLELEHRKLDVEKALKRLDIPDEKRHDTKPLANFIKFVYEHSKRKKPTYEY
jgi:GMP synthase (glutamine-hydrolysing)